MKKTRILLTLLLTLAFAGSVFAVSACGGNTGGGGRKHDKITHVIAGNEEGETVQHNFVNGKCTMCDHTTVFRQEAMYSSKEILFTEQSAANKGTVEYFWYKTRAYGVEFKQKEGDPAYGKELWIWKRAYIYLPAGYDAANTSKKYNVFYMMHGNKLNEGYWFRRGAYAPESAWSAYTGGYGTENMLDYMKVNNLAEDTLYVGMTMYQYYHQKAPDNFDPDNPNALEEADTPYVGGDARQGNVYSGFIDPENDLGIDLGIGETAEGNDSVYWKEWVNHLMPYVVNNYNTYAASTSDADLKAARDHVAFSGLSRGGSSLNCVFANCLEYVSYFCYESTGLPSEQQREMIKSKMNEYPINYILVSCGSQEGPTNADRGMLALAKDLNLKEGSDIKNGDRIEFIQVNGTAHNYATWITNLYNMMLVAFKK